MKNLVPRASGPPALAGIFLLLLFLPSCGDQVQKAKPPEKAGAAAAMPPDHPEIGHGAASKAAPADPFSEGGAAKPAMGAAPVRDPERIIVAGEIALDPGVKVGEKYTIYVATVFAPAERAPVYITKYDSPKFPFRFEIKERDKGASAGTESDRPLYVRAMISDGGDAMKNRNRTTSEQAYARGTNDVKLTIKP